MKNRQKGYFLCCWYLVTEQEWVKAKRSLASEEGAVCTSHQPSASAADGQSLDLGQGIRFRRSPAPRADGQGRLHPRPGLERADLSVSWKPERARLPRTPGAHLSPRTQPSGPGPEGWPGDRPLTGGAAGAAGAEVRLGGEDALTLRGSHNSPQF